MSMKKMSKISQSSRVTDSNGRSLLMYCQSSKSECCLRMSLWSTKVLTSVPVPMVTVTTSLARLIYT